MKSKRLLAILLAVLVILSAIPSIFTQAATGTVVANTGVRHTVCTALSEQAIDYYIDNDALFAELSLLSGGSSNCLTTVNSDLYRVLSTLMSSTMTKTVSYSSLTDHWKKTDASGGSSTHVMFYADVIGNDSINREHVWPNSHGSFNQSGGGSDPHHLRPTNSTLNSTRGNHIFANVREEVSGYKSKDYNGKTVLYYGDGYVEVKDDVKGDVARILLYVYCRWQEPNLFMDDSTPLSGSDGGKVIKNLETLLEWCEEDPVDTWEMGRNDQCENLVGNRNVFIDYPEYAWLLFGQEIPDDMTTPSGEAADSDTPSCAHTSKSYTSKDGETHSVICVLCAKAIGTEAHTLSNNTCTKCGYVKTDIETPDDGNTDGTPVVFDFGDKGSAAHVDGSGLGTSKSYTQNGYTLQLTSMANIYGGAYDLKGNSCLKIGTSSKTGTFTFTVPADVTKVVINVAQYKDNTTKITVNGTSYTISTLSNNGEYTPITVDTASNKTVTFATVSGGVRAMVDSIIYNFADSSSGGGSETPVCKHLDITYTPIDDETHSLACSDCGEDFGTDSHSFSNNTCKDCGAAAPTTDPKPDAPSSDAYYLTAVSGNTHYYFSGTTSGGAGSISTDIADAVELFKETSGDYTHFYMLDGNTKRYISIGTSSTSFSLSTSPCNLTYVQTSKGNWTYGYRATNGNIRVPAYYTTNNEIRTYLSTANYTFFTFEPAVTECSHIWGDAVVTNATYFFDGKSVKACSKCGETETTVLPKDTGKPFIYKSVAYNPATDTLTIEWSYSTAFLLDCIATQGQSPFLKFHYAFGENSYHTDAFEILGDGGIANIKGFNAQRLALTFTYYFELGWTGDITADYITAATAIPQVTENSVIPAQIATNSDTLTALNGLLSTLEDTADKDADIVSQVADTETLISNNITVNAKNATAVIRFTTSQSLIKLLNERGRENRTVTLILTIGKKEYRVDVPTLKQTTIVTISELSFGQLSSEISVMLDFSYTNPSLNFKTDSVQFDCGSIITNSDNRIATAFENYLSKLS